MFLNHQFFLHYAYPQSHTAAYLSFKLIVLIIVQQHDDPIANNWNNEEYLSWGLKFVSYWSCWG